MSIFYNPTERAITMMFAGAQFLFPPQKKVRIGTLVHAGHKYPAEDVAAHLATNGAQVGLMLLPEEAPYVTDENRMVAMTKLRQFVREQLRYFNNANLKQAADSLPTFLPDEDLLALKNMLERLEKRPAKLVSETELKEVTNRAEFSALAKIEQIRTALATGDIEVVRALVGESNLMKMSKKQADAAVAALASAGMEAEAATNAEDPDDDMIEVAGNTGDPTGDHPDLPPLDGQGDVQSAGGDDGPTWNRPELDGVGAEADPMDPSRNFLDPPANQNKGMGHGPKGKGGPKRQ